MDNQHISPNGKIQSFDLLMRLQCPRDWNCDELADYMHSVMNDIYRYYIDKDNIDILTKRLPPTGKCTCDVMIPITLKKPEDIDKFDDSEKIKLTINNDCMDVKLLDVEIKNCIVSVPDDKIQESYNDNTDNHWILSMHLKCPFSWDSNTARLCIHQAILSVYGYYIDGSDIFALVEHVLATGETKCDVTITVHPKDIGSSEFINAFDPERFKPFFNAGYPDGSVKLIVIEMRNCTAKPLSDKILELPTNFADDSDQKHFPAFYKVTVSISQRPEYERDYNVPERMQEFTDDINARIKEGIISLYEEKQFSIKNITDTDPVCDVCEKRTQKYSRILCCYEIEAINPNGHTLSIYSQINNRAFKSLMEEIKSEYTSGRIGEIDVAFEIMFNKERCDENG